MLVKALRTTDGYYKVEQGRTYVVLGCIYDMHPQQQSYNKMQYLVELSSFPHRTVISPQDAALFVVADNKIPDDWVGVNVDHDTASKIASDVISRDHRLTVIVSFPEMRDYNFYVAIHDDNLEDDEEAVVLKYSQKYKKLHAEGSS